MGTPSRKQQALRPLPRGWHPLTRQAVTASQSARLLDAIAHVVAKKGYAATSVTDIVALAGVSRRTFYELFKDKDDCFLVAYRAGMEFLLDGIRNAVSPLPESDWQGRAKASLHAYLKILASKPASAWAYTIEIMGAGPKALEYRASVLARWVRQWSTLQHVARRESSHFTEPDEHQLLALVGGIEEIVRECLRTQSAERLPSLADSATMLALSTLTGPQLNSSGVY